MMKTYRSLFAAAVTVVSLCGSIAQAGFVSSFGVTTHLLEPAGWSVGDANSTHQLWDEKFLASGNLPDKGYDTAGATLTDPTHGVKPPGFVSSSKNYYSFTGDFGGTADIYNHGGVTTGVGTHVIVQVGASVNPDTESFPGHGTGVYLNSLELVDLSNAAITGGANGDALQVAEVFYASGVPSAFGLVSYQELIYEFWLPGYTGDFRVDWDQHVHATIDTLRVDSIIATADVSGGTPFGLTTVPEPSAVVLSVSGLAALALLRRRWS